jgi:hypothetical protein
MTRGYQEYAKPCTSRVSMTRQPRKRRKALALQMALLGIPGPTRKKEARIRALHPKDLN